MFDITQICRNLPVRPIPTTTNIPMAEEHHNATNMDPANHDPRPIPKYISTQPGANYTYHQD